MIFVTILITIVVVAVMVAFNALYVAGEFAAVSARKTRITQAAEEGNRLAKALLPILKDTKRLDNYIAASQVGITLSSIVLGIYGQRQVAPLLEPLLQYLPFVNEQAAAAGIAAVLILILFTTLQVVLGELVPKSLAIRYPERVAQATVLPMRWSAEWVLRPLIVVLNGSGALLLRLLGIQQEGGHHHVHSPEEIRLLIQQSYKGGLLRDRDRELLNNAFRISDLTIGEIDVPRTRMAAIPIETPVEEALRVAIDTGYTRIPVYEDVIDHILGFVHVKDLFRLYLANAPQTDIRKIVRKVSFVPETTLVKEVWNTLNREENYLAVLINEYGGTVGMVTREDLVEELFGELRDEFDGAEEPPFTKAGANAYRVRGDASISRLNAAFDLSLPRKQVHTAGGLIFRKLKRVPKVDDEVEVAGVKLRVERVRNMAVETLILQLPETAAQKEGGA